RHRGAAHRSDAARARRRRAALPSDDRRGLDPRAPGGRRDRRDRAPVEHEHGDRRGRGGPRRLPEDPPLRRVPAGTGRGAGVGAAVAGRRSGLRRHGGRAPRPLRLLRPPLPRALPRAQPLRRAGALRSVRVHLPDRRGALGRAGPRARDREPVLRRRAEPDRPDRRRAPRLWPLVDRRPVGHGRRARVGRRGGRRRRDRSRVPRARAQRAAVPRARAASRLTDGGGQRGHGGPTAERVRLPVATARARLCALVQACDRLERVAVEDAVGRVTAEPVAARFSVGHFHSSAMDRNAVRAAETAGATGDGPLELARAAGAGAPASGAPAFAWVDTGNPLPEWADAVVMVEAVEAPEDEARSPSSAATAALPAKRSARRAERVRVRAPATPWQHVRVVGEDVVAGEEILPAGHRIRPPDVGLLLATGVTEVVVRARPRVAILPTGDELIEPGADRVPGKTIESNSRMIAAWVSEWGGEPSRLAPAPDDPARLAERLRVAARDADLVCVLAGSSAGSRDYTAEALGAIGNVFAHGIELVPGRPTILASLAGGPTSQESPEAGRARVAIGIPGYPVAAAMVCRELVQPLVARLAGTAADAPPTLAAVAAEDLVPRPGAEELVRVDVGKVGERLVARPLARGAAALASLSRAGGLVRLRPGAAPIAAGERVDVELLVPA